MDELDLLHADDNDSIGAYVDPVSRPDPAPVHPALPTRGGFAVRRADRQEEIDARWDKYKTHD